VRIPAGGVIGSMAATNIACQDNVMALTTENTKLRARITELETKLEEAKKAGAQHQ
jgi:BMFP domain-containing protein YqiC